MDQDIAYIFRLAPKRLIDWFAAKGYAFSWDWEDVWQAQHAKAFTVAKVMRADILEDIRTMVTKALEEGITFAQFRKELEPRLKRAGWWGKVTLGDGAGGVEMVQLGSVYRLKTIYRTNLQTSYMAGRYAAQAENAEARPFLQYVAVLDSRTRPSHAELNGRVFPIDDPFWNDFYPPNGWGCRCRVRALSPERLAAKGLRAESSAGKITREDRLVSRKSGEVQDVAVFRSASGLSVAPDPGWSYNPGQAAFAPGSRLEGASR
jgi:SPP1 gp7 family putative phage head morphogenesis protein